MEGQGLGESLCPISQGARCPCFGITGEFLNDPCREVICLLASLLCWKRVNVTASVRLCKESLAQEVKLSHLRGFSSSLISKENEKSYFSCHCCCFCGWALTVSLATNHGHLGKQNQEFLSRFYGGLGCYLQH